MKKENFFELLGDMDPASVKKAREYHRKKMPAWKIGTAVAACVALLGGAVLGGGILKNGVGTTEERYPSGVTPVLAAAVEPVAKNMDVQKFMESDVHWEWLDSYRELTEKSEKLQSGIEGYYASLMEQLLVSENENTVCSPINTYLAFAMLAEVSDGNTRAQILNMLGVDNVDTLRENVSALWKSNDVDTPVLKSMLANSLWLNDNITYNDTTLQRLAKQYYASTFRGTPDSKEMDQALRNWMDKHTGGLLKEYTKDMAIHPDTVMEILSTLYYKAMWVDSFQTENTTKETFHGTLGDTTVDMMKQTDTMSVYHTDHFTAVSLGLQDSGSMYFLLPEEQGKVNDLVSDPDIWNMLRNDVDDTNWSSSMVHLSVPKFKISGKVDLLETLKALGVTDALDDSLADFTPLTTDVDHLYLSKAEHAATLELDENGVTGAAYTELAIAEGAALTEDEIDFILDRPFLLLVTGSDGSVLFSGIVRNIDET